MNIKYKVKAKGSFDDGYENTLDETFSPVFEHLAGILGDTEDDTVAEKITVTWRDEMNGHRYKITYRQADD